MNRKSIYSRDACVQSLTVTSFTMLPHLTPGFSQDLGSNNKIICIKQLNIIK